MAKSYRVGIIGRTGKGDYGHGVDVAISKVPNMTRRAAWLALLFTGFRMSNIRALRWQDIDFDEGMLTLGRMKNGQKRTFPYPQS